MSREKRQASILKYKFSLCLREFLYSQFCSHAYGIKVFAGEASAEKFDNFSPRHRQNNSIGQALKHKTCFHAALFLYFTASLKAPLFLKAALL